MRFLPYFCTVLAASTYAQAQDTVCSLPYESDGSSQSCPRSAPDAQAAAPQNEIPVHTLSRFDPAMPQRILEAFQGKKTTGAQCDERRLTCRPPDKAPYVKNLFWTFGKDNPVLEVALDPAVIEAVREAIGDEIVLYAANALVRAPGDVHHFHYDPENAPCPEDTVTVWVAVQGVTPETAIHVIPGTALLESDLPDIYDHWCSQRTTKGNPDPYCALLEKQPGTVTTCDLVKSSGLSCEGMVEAFRTHETASVLAVARREVPGATVVQPQMTDGQFVIMKGKTLHGAFLNPETVSAVPDTNRRKMEKKPQKRRIALQMHFGTPRCPLRLMNAFFFPPRPDSGGEMQRLILEGNNMWRYTVERQPPIYSAALRISGVGEGGSKFPLIAGPALNSSSPIPRLADPFLSPDFGLVGLDVQDYLGRMSDEWRSQNRRRVGKHSKPIPEPLAGSVVIARVENRKWDLIHTSAVATPSVSTFGRFKPISPRPSQALFAVEHNIALHQLGTIPHEHEAHENGVWELCWMEAGVVARLGEKETLLKAQKSGGGEKEKDLGEQLSELYPRTGHLWPLGPGDVVLQPGHLGHTFECVEGVDAEEVVNPELGWIPSPERREKLRSEIRGQKICVEHCVKIKSFRPTEVKKQMSDAKKNVGYSPPPSQTERQLQKENADAIRCTEKKPCDDLTKHHVFNVEKGLDPYFLKKWIEKKKESSGSPTRETADPSTLPQLTVFLLKGALSPVSPRTLPTQAASSPPEQGAAEALSTEKKSELLPVLPAAHL
uniref:Cupin type-1 domain-containing protein n=1 Tax=Chromera velia CCMP2878 TaxID=1169474 RepID=A0A0G4IDL4_9ALVE|eukprot:Cvel_13318.t1-p1 / transcript=Cvel_13318.t1 / gene=Cvel_13318 / organism=Chromera_velia_CCMP2878 / gene_product=hypothetical protein / transcript_product=hypothetical protein / location=Cvel_scaffold904:13414-15828(+) / protein_length=774 / sequence_SO=supercontig / SO=protein_coding / is_pseudo=false